MHSDDQVDGIIQDGKDRISAAGAEVVLFGAREGLEIKV
jgi:hypothetical protein